MRFRGVASLESIPSAWLLLMPPAARWPRAVVSRRRHLLSCGETRRSQIVMAAAVGATRAHGVFVVEESRDGERTNSGWAHVEPWIRIDECGAAAPDCQHGRQGRSRREAQLLAEP